MSHAHLEHSVIRAGEGDEQGRNLELGSGALQPRGSPRMDDPHPERGWEWQKKD